MSNKKIVAQRNRDQRGRAQVKDPILDFVFKLIMLDQTVEKYFRKTEMFP